MLKIKDNVDLKELEKFGFYYNDNCKRYEKIVNLQLYYITIMVFQDNPNYKKNEIVCQSSIWYDLSFSDERMSHLVLDLIDAKLVEKE